MRTVGGITNTVNSNYLFAAVPSPSFGSEGVIDVIDISSSGGFRVDTSAFLPGKQSIPCTNASGLMDYWRQ